MDYQKVFDKFDDFKNVKHTYIINMSELLLGWLNDEVQLSKRIFNF